MAILRFILEVMVCISECINQCVKITLSKSSKKSQGSNLGPRIKLTAMSYNKAGDLIKLSDVSDPQCKCDHRG